MATPWFRLFPPEEQEDLVFLGDPGPRHLNGDEEDPIDFFTLLFPANTIAWGSSANEQVSINTFTLLSTVHCRLLNLNFLFGKYLKNITVASRSAKV